MYRGIVSVLDYDRYPTKQKPRHNKAVENLPSTGNSMLVYTPQHIVDDMIGMFTEKIWEDPNTTILDIYCKSGRFLEAAYWKLYDGLKHVIKDSVDRSDHILTKQLFGIAAREDLAKNIRKVLYGTHRANHPKGYTRRFKTEDGNIKVLEIYRGDLIIDFADMVKDNTRILIRGALEEAFGIMKFDVVVGNPPYNKGMDLDFVNLGFDLCNKYCMMITPAKWQTTADDYVGCTSKTIDYKGFREKLVPHMSKVVFYPDCVDIFSIAQVDGISYFLLEKDKTFTECEVENKCLKQKYFNSKQTRSILNRETLHNIGNDIINSLGHYESYKFKVPAGKRYEVWTNSQTAVSSGPEAGRYLLGKGEGNMQVISLSRILDKSKGETPTIGTSSLTFASDDIDECKSFISWLNTKFTRFFVAINLSKLTGILTDDCFRFVPAPPSGKFDHIYTDDELYKAFNVPQEYIDVIEAVIKERK